MEKRKENKKYSTWEDGLKAVKKVLTERLDNFVQKGMMKEQTENPGRKQETLRIGKDTSERIENMETQGLMDVGQAAAYLAVPKSRIYDLVFKKRVPFFKLGASVRFRMAELNIWLEGNRQGLAEVYKSR